MAEKLDLNFVKKLQRTVEPQMRPGETALEAIKRMEAEKVVSMIQNTPPSSAPRPPETPAQEVIFYQGYKLPRDFFTCIALCIMKLNKPEINEILEVFGFTMNDLMGKPVVLTRSRKTRRRTSKK